MRKLIFLTVITLFSACAHQPTTNPNQVAKEGADPGVQDTIASFKVTDMSGPEQKDVELDNIPVEVNPLVDKWIGYFKGRGRHHMERYLARSTRYEKLMKKVLRDNGLPEDLFYIALIESGFTSHATSHASAVGYWQFIRGTGARYGLEISKFVDDRRDPVMATQAAADYFKGLYSVFGSWYLAMASYNAGENRIKRVVMENQTRDFWELAKKKLLPEETINYVPKFIAAKLIAKNPESYGFGEIDYLTPIEFDTVTLAFPVNLRAMADKMDYNYEDFKALNPKFKGEAAPLQKDVLNLRVPPGTQDKALQAAAESKMEKMVYVADQGDTATYKIRRGDTLASVARQYRTTIAYLRDLNDMPRGRKLRIGSRLMVPDRTPMRTRGSANVTKAKPEEVAASSKVPEGTQFHIVQSGESLFSIAKKYNTSVSQLQRLNKIQRGKSLRVGVKLRVPGSDGSQKSMNSSSRRPAKNSKMARLPASSSKKITTAAKNKKVFASSAASKKAKITSKKKKVTKNTKAPKRRAVVVKD